MKRLLQASLWYDAPARCPQTASFFGMSTVLDYTLFQALKESEQYAECYFLLSINQIYIYTVPLSEIPASDVSVENPASVSVFPYRGHHPVACQLD